MFSHFSTLLRYLLYIVCYHENLLTWRLQLAHSCVPNATPHALRLILCGFYVIILTQCLPQFPSILNSQRKVVCLVLAVCNHTTSRPVLADPCAASVSKPQQQVKAFTTLEMCSTLYVSSRFLRVAWRGLVAYYDSPWRNSSDQLEPTTLKALVCHNECIRARRDDLQSSIYIKCVEM